MKKLLFAFILLLAVASAAVARSFVVEKNGQNVGAVNVSWQGPYVTDRDNHYKYYVKVGNGSNEYVSGIVVGTGCEDDASAGFELGPKENKQLTVFTEGKAYEFVIPVMNVR